MSDKRHAPLAKVTHVTKTKTTVTLTESHVHRAIVEYLRKHGYADADHDTEIVVEGFYVSDALPIDATSTQHRATAAWENATHE